MKTAIGLYFTILILNLIPGLTLAQSFKVELSNDSILLGNSFLLEFELENVSGDFEAPDFSQFEVLSGPNMSSSYQSINGKQKSIMKYSYRLKPTETGEYYIGSALLETDEAALESSPIHIMVYPNPDGIIQETEMENSFFNFEFPQFDADFFNLDKRLNPKDSLLAPEKKKSSSKRKLKRI